MKMKESVVSQLIPGPDISLCEPKIKQVGIVLSYIMQFEDSVDQEIRAAYYLTSFQKAVAELANEGFPRLTATLVSKQEYKL